MIDMFIYEVWNGPDKLGGLWMPPENNHPLALMIAAKLIWPSFNEFSFVPCQIEEVA